MKPTDAIQKVIKQADDVDMDNIDFNISSFALFDNDFEEAFDISEMVKDTLPMFKILGELKSQMLGKETKEDDSRNKMVKLIVGHGYSIALKTYNMKRNLHNLIEIKFSKEIEKDFSLAKSILDMDEMEDFNSGNIEALNKKYNLIFGSLNYYINIHWLNLKTGKSKFFSAEMEKKENGKYLPKDMFENYTCNIFQKSIRLYKRLSREIPVEQEGSQIDILSVETEIKPSLLELLNKKSKRASIFDTIQNLLDTDND